MQTQPALRLDSELGLSTGASPSIITTYWPQPLPPPSPPPQSLLHTYLTPWPCLPPPSPPPPHTMQDGKLSNGARLTAGLGAGVSEALLIVTPFEVVKTRLQQQKGVDPSLFKYKVSGDL